MVKQRSPKPPMGVRFPQSLPSMKYQHTNLKEEKWPKLVRDKIPKITEQNEFVKVQTKILRDDSEYIAALLQKMEEEKAELKHAILINKGVVEDLADQLEILLAIAKAKGISWKDVEAARKDKRRKRGGFDKRIMFLRKVPK